MSKVFKLGRRPGMVTVHEVIDNLKARADYGRSEGMRGGLEAWQAVGEIIIAISEITGQPIEDVRKVFDAG